MEMHLNQISFERMKSGKKKIELRLFDEKRQKLKVGDVIVFTNVETNEKLTTKAIELIKLKSFKEAIDKIPAGQIRFNMDEKQFIDYLYKRWTKHDEQKYGVLAIRIELL